MNNSVQLLRVRFANVPKQDQHQIGQNGECICQGGLSGHHLITCTARRVTLAMWQDVCAPFRLPEKNGSTQFGGKNTRIQRGRRLMKDVGEVSLTLAGIWHRP